MTFVTTVSTTSSENQPLRAVFLHPEMDNNAPSLARRAPPTTTTAITLAIFVTISTTVTTTSSLLLHSRCQGVVETWGFGGHTDVNYYQGRPWEGSKISEL